MDPENTEVIEPVAPEVVPEEVTPEVTPEEKLGETPEEGTPEVPAEEAPEVQPKTGFERKVHKLTQKAKEAEQEAAYWRKQATEAKATPAPAPDTKPKFADYNDIEAYGEAIGNWTATNAVRQAMAERDKEQGSRNVIQTYQTRLDAFKKVTPDFDDAFADLDGVSLPEEVMQGILEAEEGPQLAYHLAKNLDLVEKLAGMSPYQRLVQLGKIGASLVKGKPEPSVKKISSAPAGLKSPNASNTSTKSEDSMSPEEWIKWRNKTAGRR